MRHRSLVAFVCFCCLSLGSRTADAKKKLQIDRAEGPVDQSVFERGLVTEDVKARDILQAGIDLHPFYHPPGAVCHVAILRLQRCSS